jgi:hypothetical protein
MPESGPKTPKSWPCYLFTCLAIYLDDAILVEIGVPRMRKKSQK